MSDLDRFRDIPTQMYWRGPALHQISEFEKLVQDLGFPWVVVGEHTSKSIRLPVICLIHDGVKFYLRDNFHDINLCVVAERPIEIPQTVLFEGVLLPQTWGWYLDEIARCRGYSWRSWTDEQMDDPNLLALTPDAPSYQVKRPEEKAAWVKRMTDPTWYAKNWSSGTITWDGEFGPGAKLWVQYHPYLQGIESITLKAAHGVYRPGCKGFALALGKLAEAKILIQRISKASSCSFPSSRWGTPHGENP